MAWAERIRHEMDAYDIMVPKLIGNKDFKRTIDYLTYFQRIYKPARENVREQLEKMNLDKHLFNADFKMIHKETGSMK